MISIALLGLVAIGLLAWQQRGLTEKSLVFFFVPVYLTTAWPWISVLSNASSGGGNGVDVSLSLVLSALLGGSLLISNRLRLSMDTDLSRAVGAFVWWNLAVLALSLVIYQMIGAVLFAAQILVPATAFYVGRSVCRTRTEIRRFLLLGAIGSAVGCLFVLSVQFELFGGLARTPSEVRVLAEVIPQVRGVFPAILAFGVYFAIVTPDISRRMRVLFLGLFGAASVTVWSRTGLISVAVVAVFSIVEQLRRRRLSAARMGLAIYGLVGVAFVLLGASGYSVAAQRATAEGDERRATLLIEGINYAWAHPLIGDAFRPIHRATDFGLFDRDRAIIFPAHNQIVDLAIRSGILSSILFLLISIAAYRSSTKLVPSLPILAGFWVSFGGQLWLAQGLSAVPFWLFLGVVDSSGALSVRATSSGVLRRRKDNVANRTGKRQPVRHNLV